MKTCLQILVLASSLLFINTSPVSDSLPTEEGSGDGPEIVINDVVEKNVDIDNAVEENASETDPIDLIGMEMNPEENEVNDKSVDELENKLANKKCKKCIRGHYRSRNVDFCESCEKKKGNKDEKITEKKQVNVQNRCKRCARKNFKARNEEFCSDECSSVDINKPAEKKHNKKKHAAKNKETNEAVTSTTEAVTTTKAVVKVLTPVEETTEKVMEKDTEDHQKKNKNKRKHQKSNKNDRKKKNKNKKHNEMNTEEVKDEDNKDILSEVEEESLEEPEEQKDTVKLGPLENLIKFLINSNTYTH